MQFILLLIFLLLLSPHTISAKLSLNYYNTSCPNLHQIIADILTTKQAASPTTAAGVLRLFFHDCFASGCDASLLISPTRLLPSERSADINLSLPGDAFDAIARAKSSLEIQCPGAVSCADILAVAARDLLSILGGPFFPVPLGRRDSLSSSPALAEPNLPRPNAPIPKILRLFASKGFSARDLVALSGAHTVGLSHCREYAGRIFHFNKGGPMDYDPAMDPRFARGLQRACGNYARDPNVATFNDVVTPGKFDNVYYQNLVRGLGLLGSDQGMVEDARTAGWVRLYAANQSAFFEDFARGMEKLSVYGVKTGRDGEVRRRCDVFNN